ncbi:MAG TPA: hypothetical protein VMU94_28510 [Streptosporangiaceae bacterium]|nr:hypothetical protein [Streptosporangiaceae bacterium]
MTLRVPAAAIAPDFRFGAAGALADPASSVEIGGLVIRAEGCLPQSAAIPRYLRYADRDAVIVAEGVGEFEGLESCLSDQIRASAECDALEDLSTAVIALDAVDRCFRESGLWPGNIYLAGVGALAVVLDLGQDDRCADIDAEAVLRELAALELGYLFPIAGKFRSGAYDGQIQYRLNGWGRSLARRLTAPPGGRARAAAFRQALSRHIARERQCYASFLAGLDVAHQRYGGDRLDPALALPIPILV